jgi:hypothetical protein
LVMTALSSTDTYTKVPFVSLLSVNSTGLLILCLIVSWLDG